VDDRPGARGGVIAEAGGDVVRSIWSVSVTNTDDLVGNGGMLVELASNAFVFGAETTRRRNLAAADDF